MWPVNEISGIKMSLLNVIDVESRFSCLFCRCLLPSLWDILSTEMVSVSYMRHQKCFISDIYTNNFIFKGNIFNIAVNLPHSPQTNTLLITSSNMNRLIVWYAGVQRISKYKYVIVCVLFKGIYHYKLVCARPITTRHIRTFIPVPYSINTMYVPKCTMLTL